MDENTNNENQDILEELNDDARNGVDAPKKIEVIKGNGDLTISPVYEHLEVEKPKPKENKTIFIPEVKKELIQETSENNESNKENENPQNSDSSENFGSFENSNNSDGSNNSEDSDIFEDKKN